MCTTLRFTAVFQADHQTTLIKMSMVAQMKAYAIPTYLRRTPLSLLQLLVEIGNFVVSKETTLVLMGMRK